ncbi:unnamed protein product, partial [Amoebophrya sp. A120]
DASTPLPGEQTREAEVEEHCGEAGVNAEACGANVTKVNEKLGNEKILREEGEAYVGKAEAIAEYNTAVRLQKEAGQRVADANRALAQAQQTLDRNKENKKAARDSTYKAMAQLQKHESELRTQIVDETDQTEAAIREQWKVLLQERQAFYAAREAFQSMHDICSALIDPNDHDKCIDKAKVKQYSMVQAKKALLNAEAKYYEMKDDREYLEQYAKMFMEDRKKVQNEHADALKTYKQATVELQAATRRLLKSQALMRAEFRSKLFGKPEADASTDDPYQLLLKQLYATSNSGLATGAQAPPAAGSKKGAENKGKAPAVGGGDGGAAQPGAGAALSSLTDSPATEASLSAEVFAAKQDEARFLLLKLQAAASKMDFADSWAYRSSKTDVDLQWKEVFAADKRVATCDEETEGLWRKAMNAQMKALGAGDDLLDKFLLAEAVVARNTVDAKVLECFLEREGLGRAMRKRAQLAAQVRNEQHYMREKLEKRLTDAERILLIGQQNLLRADRARILAEEDAEMAHDYKTDEVGRSAAAARANGTAIELGKRVK